MMMMMMVMVIVIVMATMITNRGVSERPKLDSRLAYRARKRRGAHQKKIIAPI